MEYLSRDSSPISAELWSQIDDTVVGTARRVLTGRRFLHVFGPLGVGVESIPVDDEDELEQVSADGFITTKGRKVMEIPTIYEDFTLLARNIAASRRAGLPADLAKTAAAAEACALKEDRLIFFGNAALGYEGLLTAPGTGKVTKKDWMTGENAFTDIATAIEQLTAQGIYGGYALAVSPTLYLQMQRIQPGTGLLEVDRVSKLLDGHVYKTPVLVKDQAVLVCFEPRNVDLAVGQDIATAYLEQKDLNHSFRVLETILLRIKRRKAVVVFG